MNSIFTKKHVSQGQEGGGGGGGGNSIVPFKVGGALVDSVHVATAVNQPYSPARLSSLQSEGARHHCVTPLPQHMRILPQQNSQKLSPEPK